MARKFDADFNNEINRTIKSFNQKIKRAEARGQKGLPDLRSVREFKQTYATKRDAKKELSYLRELLNNKQALQRRRTEEGTISNWEFDYIVKNLEETKRWVNRELEKAVLRVKDYPEHLYSIRADVSKLEAERDYLQRDINKLNARELRTVGAIEARMKRAELKTITGRKFFMDNLERIMAVRVIPVKDRKNIIKKLDSLTNEEFLELYKTHDIVSTIMEYYTPSDNEVKVLEDLNNDEEFDEIIDEFNENIDTYITESKESVQKIRTLVDKGTGKTVTKKDFEKYVRSGKW